MHIGGRWGARPAVAAVRRGACRLTRAPAFGVAAIAPLVFASAVGSAAPVFPENRAGARRYHPGGRGRRVRHRPVRSGRHRHEAPADQLPRGGSYHIGSTTTDDREFAWCAWHSGHGTVRLPQRRAEDGRCRPGCGVSWNLLAGIGRIESMHANGGATDARGTAIQPIYGPTLDGTLPGNEIIIQSSVGNRVTYARAMGPMQFLPGTWARYATDGDDDGVADPQNLFDSTLAAARYLCSGGLNLRDPAQVMAALLRYNNSMPYAQNVLGWAAGYATGVFPVDLPPITGPPPPLGDAHLENPEGLGPGLPINVNGLTADGPMAHLPLIDLTPRQAALNPPPMFPWMAPDPSAPMPGCTLICIGSHGPPVGAPPFPPTAPHLHSYLPLPTSGSIGRPAWRRGPGAAGAGSCRLTTRPYAAAYTRR